MIKDAVLHLLGEQPLLVDLFEAPSPSDVAVVCTNVRTTAGKRPAFIDRMDSTFVFPYVQVRFLEVLRGGLAGIVEALETPEAAPAEADEELDEDFLRRIREA
jgi:hypothetical protein